MSDLRDLYQEVILDHSQSPRNHQDVEEASHSADGHNPLCGDRVHITVKLKDDRVEEVGFTGTGCAISTASASILTETLQGKSVEEAKEIFERFHQMATAEPGTTPDESLGKLAVLAGVSEFPARVKCATLSWHTFVAAIDEAEDVTTE